MISVRREPWRLSVRAFRVVRILGQRRCTLSLCVAFQVRTGYTSHVLHQPLSSDRNVTIRMPLIRLMSTQSRWCFSEMSSCHETCLVATVMFDSVDEMYTYLLVLRARLISFPFVIEGLVFINLTEFFRCRVLPLGVLVVHRY
jgi:hypothetical protein